MMLLVPTVPPLVSVDNNSLLGSLLVAVTVRSLAGVPSTEAVTSIHVLKPSEKPVMDKCPAGVVPCPVSETVCGLPLALSVMFNVPVRVPAAVGAKDTSRAELPCGGITTRTTRFDLLPGVVT